LLAGLALAFLARVVGQAVVAFFGVPWLPPMEQWYSGLIPYPVLLPIQVLILALQGKISVDLWRGGGWFARARPRGGAWLKRLAWLYLAVMIARFLLTSAGRIPIFFHWVLAVYLWTLGRVLARRDA
jgi:hypothetical protein